MRTLLVIVLTLGVWEGIRRGHVILLRYWWHQNH